METEEGTHDLQLACDEAGRNHFVSQVHTWGDVEG